MLELGVYGLGGFQCPSAIPHAMTFLTNGWPCGRSCLLREHQISGLDLLEYGEYGFGVVAVGGYSVTTCANPLHGFLLQVLNATLEKTRKQSRSETLHCPKALST